MILVPMDCGLTAVLDELGRTGLQRADYAVYRCARNYEGVSPAEVWCSPARKPVRAVVTPCAPDAREGWFQFTIWEPSQLVQAQGVLIELWDWELLPLKVLERAWFRIKDVPYYRDTPAFYWCFWRWNEWRSVRNELLQRLETVLCVPASARFPHVQAKVQAGRVSDGETLPAQVED